MKVMDNGHPDADQTGSCVSLGNEHGSLAIDQCGQGNALL